MEDRTSIGRALHAYEPVRLTFVYPDYPSGICVYCGEYADQMDHLLPRAYTGESLRRRVPVVPACGECNRTLSDAFIPDVQERRDLVHRRYMVKYRKRLKMLVRTADGLDELGPTLRGHIQRMQSEHESVMRRLQWPIEVDYDAKAWQHAWERERDV